MTRLYFDQDALAHELDEEETGSPLSFTGLNDRNDSQPATPDSPGSHWGGNEENTGEASAEATAVAEVEEPLAVVVAAPPPYVRPAETEPAPASEANVQPAATTEQDDAPVAMCAAAEAADKAAQQGENLLEEGGSLDLSDDLLMGVIDEVAKEDIAAMQELNGEKIVHVEVESTDKGLHAGVPAEEASSVKTLLSLHNPVVKKPRKQAPSKKRAAEATELNSVGNKRGKAYSLSERNELVKQARGSRLGWGEKLHEFVKTTHELGIFARFPYFRWQTKIANKPLNLRNQKRCLLYFLQRCHADGLIMGEFLQDNVEDSKENETYLRENSFAGWTAFTILDAQYFYTAEENLFGVGTKPKTKAAAWLAIGFNLKEIPRVCFYWEIARRYAPKKKAGGSDDDDDGEDLGNGIEQDLEVQMDD